MALIRESVRVFPLALGAVITILLAGTALGLSEIATTALAMAALFAVIVPPIHRAGRPDEGVPGPETNTTGRQPTQSRALIAFTS